MDVSVRLRGSLRPRERTRLGQVLTEEFIFSNISPFPFFIQKELIRPQAGALGVPLPSSLPDLPQFTLTAGVGSAHHKSPSRWERAQPLQDITEVPAMERQPRRVTPPRRDETFLRWVPHRPSKDPSVTEPVA